MMNYDFISKKNSPVNKSAAMVISKGCNWNPSCVKSYHGYHSPLPIEPMMNYIGSKKHDMKGEKFGRFVVIEYYGKIGRCAKWICRCCCGAYELRTHKAINNIKNTDDCCIVCRRIKFFTGRFRY